MTLLSCKNSSQIFCRMDGKAGFVLTMYGNSSSTITFFCSGRYAATARNRSAQSENVTLPSSAFPVALAITPAIRFMLCASTSSVARKYTAGLSLINSLISRVFPTRRRP